MTVYDLKEQCIALWIDTINNPVDHVYFPVSPIVFFGSAHHDGNGAPIWISERSFGITTIG